MTSGRNAGPILDDKRGSRISCCPFPVARGTAESRRSGQFDGAGHHAARPEGQAGGMARAASYHKYKICFSRAARFRAGGRRVGRSGKREKMMGEGRKGASHVLRRNATFRHQLSWLTGFSSKITFSAALQLICGSTGFPGFPPPHLKQPEESAQCLPCCSQNCSNTLSKLSLTLKGSR